MTSYPFSSELAVDSVDAGMGVSFCWGLRLRLMEQVDQQLTAIACLRTVLAISRVLSPDNRVANPSTRI
ncbi:hypothetical protein JCM12141A_05550 [Mycolicibacterium hodleri]